MEYTQFGRTALHVSKISYGTWQFGGDWGRIERSQWDAGKATVQKALELGINFFDTERMLSMKASASFASTKDVPNAEHITVNTYEQ
ncbi:MAG TPA: aldo/keto reductase [Ktedonobacteraceae bacterium]